MRANRPGTAAYRMRAMGALKVLLTRDQLPPTCGRVERSSVSSGLGDLSQGAGR